MQHAELRVVPGTGCPEQTVPVDELPITALPLTAVVGTLSPRGSKPDPAHVRMLADLDDEVPPILVHRPTMRVVDGLHRLEAARLLGRTHIAARLLEGDEADAFVLAVRSNIAHGLPLSVDDRKRAVDRIMSSHPLWSDRRIAAATGLAARTVAEVRRRRGDVAGARVGRDGRVRPVNGTAGRQRAAQLILDDPSLSLRQVARVAGISPETVRDVRAKLRERGNDAGRAPRPVAVRPSPQGRSVHHPSGRPAPGGLKAVATLRADPSLRFTDTGRMLLRLLDLHAVSDPHWTTIIDAVPPHTVESVAEVARACAVMWTDLSRRLEPGVRTIA
jgi:ParB-like chromosome segregation protein Spo0J